MALSFNSSIGLMEEFIITNDDSELQDRKNWPLRSFKRGDCVNFKGDANYKPTQNTFVWAFHVHDGPGHYYIEHEDGEYLYEKLKHNGGFKDGFESLHSSMLQPNIKYIVVWCDFSTYGGCDKTDKLQMVKPFTS